MKVFNAPQYRFGVIMIRSLGSLASEIIYFILTADLFFERGFISFQRYSLQKLEV